MRKALVDHRAHNRHCLLSSGSFSLFTKMFEGALFFKKPYLILKQWTIISPSCHYKLIQSYPHYWPFLLPIQLTLATIYWLPLGTSLAHFNTLLNSEFNTHLWVDSSAALTTWHSDLWPAYFCISSNISEHFCFSYFLLLIFLHPVSVWSFTLRDSTTTVC